MLYSFGLPPDGNEPQSRLTLDRKGNLYGTTSYGGNQNCAFGCGTVFEVAPDGTEKVLHLFCSAPNCTDGAYPYAGLTVDRNGILYGTAAYGGNPSCLLGEGCGLVFALAPDGTETVLHAFTGGSDGNFPAGDLIEDKAGRLYGTAGLAGVSDCVEPFDRCGTVFRLAK